MILQHFLFSTLSPFSLSLFLKLSSSCAFSLSLFFLSFLFLSLRISLSFVSFPSLFVLLKVFTAKIFGSSFTLKLPKFSGFVQTLDLWENYPMWSTLIHTMSHPSWLDTCPLLGICVPISINFIRKYYSGIIFITKIYHKNFNLIHVIPIPGWSITLALFIYWLVRGFRECFFVFGTFHLWSRCGLCKVLVSCVSLFGFFLLVGSFWVL